MSLPLRKVKKELLNLYYIKFKTFGFNKKDIRKIIENCVKEAEESGTNNMNKNFGDYLLWASDNGDEKCITFIEKSKLGGALESDIRHWWNLYDLERRLLQWEDNFFRIQDFEKLKSEGFSEEEAAKNVNISRPVYGDPTDESRSHGVHRPLAEELHNRVNKLVVAMESTDWEEAFESGSFNAYVRKKFALD